MNRDEEQQMLWEMREVQIRYGGNLDRFGESYLKIYRRIAPGYDGTISISGNFIPRVNYEIETDSDYRVRLLEAVYAKWGLKPATYEKYYDTYKSVPMGFKEPTKTDIIDKALEEFAIKHPGVDKAWLKALLEMTISSFDVNSFGGISGGVPDFSIPNLNDIINSIIMPEAKPEPTVKVNLSIAAKETAKLLGDKHNVHKPDSSPELADEPIEPLKFEIDDLGDL